MRLDLGLLQMEVHGRPDGRRPYGKESYLHYFEERLSRYVRIIGSDKGFSLSEDQCQRLREEAVMYYHRYLSLFILGDFPGVVRDTARTCGCWICARSTRRTRATGSCSSSTGRTSS